MNIGNRKWTVLPFALAISTFTLSYCVSQPQTISLTEHSLNSEAVANLESMEWIHGSDNCNSLVLESSYQEWQKVQYQPKSFIFRQNKCSHYEAPFVYLFIGQERALLIDSGATIAGGLVLRQMVRDITDLPVLLAHTHGHSDHRQGDEAFLNRKGISVVEAGPSGLKNYFGFENWPYESTTVDLGGRVIGLLPIPGHSDDDLAFYDEQSKVVVTGDTLYPGRLYVRDWAEYRESINRLADWITNKSVSFVLGTHVEMSSTPNSDYPIGTIFQPKEHKLPLKKSDIYILRDQMKILDAPEKTFLGSYVIWPI